jgi:GT2 family glycosyltransferase
VVVDNASTDGSAETAELLGGRVVRLTKNIGFSAANNLGFALTESKFVAFVNPDVRTTSASLIKLGQVIEKHNCLVAPQLIYPNGLLQPNGRGAPTLVRKVLSRLLEGYGTESGYYKIAEEGNLLEVAWLMGAVICGSRESLASLGPWNESYFLYYEDSDLCLRASSLGMKCFVLGSEKWTHRWDRATERFRVLPWIRELSSAYIFYTTYPELVFGKVGKHET